MTQLQTIIPRDSVRLVGKTRFVKYRIHKISGAISCEWTPGAIGPMGSWSKAEDQYARPRVAKARHRARPISLILVGATFGFGNSLTVSAEAGAALARDNVLLNEKKSRRQNRLGGAFHFFYDSGAKCT